MSSFTINNLEITISELITSLSAGRAAFYAIVYA